MPTIGTPLLAYCSITFRRKVMTRSVLGLGVVFLVVALIAALFGFGVVSAESWYVAKIFFFVFLVLAVVAFVGGFFTRTRYA
jgi:uncharacterized membrane protein YtjA (UPF0391 family)